MFFMFMTGYTFICIVIFCYLFPAFLPPTTTPDPPKSRGVLGDVFDAY